MWRKEHSPDFLFEVLNPLVRAYQDVCEEIISPTNMRDNVVRIRPNRRA